jgi:hypothetical protein
MRAAMRFVILIVVVGCATPNKYVPGPDAGGGDDTHDAAGLVLDAPLAKLDGAAIADVSSPDIALAIDQTTAPDVAFDQPPAPDATIRPDKGPLLAEGQTCGGDQVCKSGHCVDSVCCVRVCDVCQRCVGPGGTCESIPAGQPDQDCTGTHFCDGQNPPRCLECAKCSDNSCIRNRWTFDSGTLEGATVDPGVYTQSPGVGQAPAYLGKQSLAMTIPVEFTAMGDSFYARFHVCEGTNTANLKTHTFRVRVFLETVNQATSVPFALILYSDQQVDAIASTPYSAGSWIILEGKLPLIEDGKVADLILSVGSAMNQKWSGRVWVDDVFID